jgi:hypothetical protein
MYCQIQLIQAGNSDPTMRLLIPALTALVAVLPSFVHSAHRRGHVRLAWFLAFVCAGLFTCNLINTMGRADDMRAGRGATAEQAHRQLAEAGAALQRAEEMSEQAQVQVDKFCTSTTTVATDAGAGKHRVHTESKTANPLCEHWSTQLLQLNLAVETARTAKGKIVVPEIDADVKRLAERFHVAPETVAIWQPTLWPLMLELSLMGSFWFGFLPTPRREEYEAPRWGSNVVPLAPRDALITRQEAVTTRVAVWLRDEGLPVGCTVSEACDKFNRWLASQPGGLVHVKTFGIALSQLSVQKRQKGGRTLIADASYQPRPRQPGKCQPRLVVK